MDEEAKLIVTRYDLAEEKGNLVDDLMEEILKEDVKPNLICYFFPVDHILKFLV